MPATLETACGCHYRRRGVAAGVSTVEFRDFSIENKGGYVHFNRWQWRSHRWLLPHWITRGRR